jgi:putative photosynthetic complex assembly protein
MSALDREPFPRGALIAASALIGFSLIITAAGRLARLNAPLAPAEASQPAPSQSVDLRFVDEANGSVSVRDSRTDREIANLAPGTNGFVRGVMRGLAHDRLRHGLSAEPPFRLSRWDDGRMALIDTATGRVIDLDAFGGSNKDAFARLLHPQGSAS